MKNISIKELKKLKINKIQNYKIIKPNKLIVTFDDENKYILNDIKIIRRSGSHLLIKKDNEEITLNSSIQKTVNALFTSIIGLIVTIIITLISTVNFINKKVDPIQERIQELKKIQTSLSLLTDYVKNQQIKLQELDNTINSLEEQKKKIEYIISLDKVKVEALLEYQNIKNIREKWIERIISFFIGVFSSLIATFLYILLKPKILKIIKVKSSNNSV